MMRASAPRHRYATLTYGSHFLSLMFGVGVVSMIGDMMARSGLDCRQSLAARQMLLAVVRGLAFATVWSPMAMSFAIVSTALPNLEPLKFVAVGLLLAASQWIFGFADLVWWPHVVVGLASVVIPSLTEGRSHVRSDAAGGRLNR